MVAAVGMDGTRLKVFGLGVTEEDAEADALVRMAEADVELVEDEPPALAFLELTPEQAIAVTHELKARDAAADSSARGLIASPYHTCPARSDQPCEYNEDEDPNHDECVHCGNPEERK